MAHTLDELDRRLLNELQRDSGVALESLAERVHLSRNACWRRIKMMEESGIIRGRVALVDPDAVGLGLAVLVMIRTNAHDPNWLQAFERAVRIMPEILSAHRMTGELDYVLRVRVRDMAGYDRFYKRLIQEVPVSDISASFVMEDIKDTTALPVLEVPH